MKKIIRNIFIIATILVLMLGFTPSYTSLSIDNLAYVIALGIDAGENEKFKITFQFTTGSPNPEAGSTEKSPSIVNSVEANSIDSAINLMDAYMARELNFSHCRLFIFSEEVAANGISDEIYTLANDTEIRPSANVIVCKNKAKDYIASSEPILENLITKYYELFPNSGKYTGYIYDVTLGDFFNQLICNTCEPFAILGGVNDNTVDASTSSKSSDVSDIKATDDSISAQRGSENLGVAVFKGDKLVGELTALETLCLSIIRGKVDSFLISINDPQNEQEKVDLMFSAEKSPKIKVDIVNNTPYVSIDLTFTGRIYSMKEDLRYLDTSVLDSLTEAASNYMKNILTQYLYKTSVEFKADINGIGKYCLQNFLTIQEFENFDWKNNYTNSAFKVSVDAEIESGFLVTET